MEHADQFPISIRPRIGRLEFGIFFRDEKSNKSFKNPEIKKKLKSVWKVNKKFTRDSIGDPRKT